MKKTLIVYFSSFIVIGLLLYFFSMSWMNFLFQPALTKEINLFLTGLEKLHPQMTQSAYLNFSEKMQNAVKILPVFTTQYNYLSKINPCFKEFEDTFTYVDFWDDTLYSASVLPVDFLMVDQTVLVDSSIGNVIPENAEILAINEKNIAEIMSFFTDFVYASTEDERMFWAIERDYMNFFPEFFKAKNYKIRYKLNSTVEEVALNAVPWNEYSNWRKRRDSAIISIQETHEMTVIKLLDLKYDNNKIHSMRTVLENIVQKQPDNLIVDISGCKGIDTNYYMVQLLLSFLSDQEQALIPEQDTKYSQERNKIAVIPQETTYQGNLYFLTSKYSIYPLVRSLIAFSERTGIGKLIGEAPLSELDYFSNPFSEPLYNSYLIPRINRIQNKFNVILQKEDYFKYHEFSKKEYIIIQKYNEETLQFISDTFL